MSDRLSLTERERTALRYACQSGTLERFAQSCQPSLTFVQALDLFGRLRAQEMVVVHQPDADERVRFAFVVPIREVV